MNEQVKEIIYRNHRPRINGIIQKIDNCWNNENKAGMLKYVKYIQHTVDFIGGDVKNA